MGGRFELKVSWREWSVRGRSRLSPYLTGAAGKGSKSRGGGLAGRWTGQEVWHFSRSSDSIKAKEARSSAVPGAETVNKQTNGTEADIRMVGKPQDKVRGSADLYNQKWNKELERMKNRSNSKLTTMTQVTIFPPRPKYREGLLRILRLIAKTG